LATHHRRRLVVGCQSAPHPTKIDPLDDFVVVNNASERQVWVERRTAGDDDAASLLRVLQGLNVPHGDGFVWIAAEAEGVRMLRRHMLEVRAHARAWVKASGYWVRGRDGVHVSFKADEQG
jgi:NADPH-dependent ferric siderophore reductase